MEKVLIIGAGPAGLAAAYAAGQQALPCLVVEQGSQVGGLSRTVSYQGCRFDIGPHRFFTKNPEVQRLWEETLGEEFLAVPRLTRIFSQGRFFLYPLKLGNVLAGLGPWASAKAMVSYLRQQVWPDRADSYAGWVTRQFGRSLYNKFFKDYTAKVWGLPGECLSPDWAVQRIRNLSLWRAVKQAVWPGGNGQVASLVDHFRYPRLGAGQMYETLAARVRRQGAAVALQTRAVRLRHRDGLVFSVVCQGPEGQYEVPASQVLASLPITELAQRLDPPPPGQVVESARALSYQSLILVFLRLCRPLPVPDQWLYLQDPGVRAGRLSLPANFSPGLVPPGQGAVCLEYFCSPKGRLWQQSDEGLVSQALADLAHLGWVWPSEVAGHLVVRVKYAYPVYTLEYRRHLAVLRDYLAGFANLHCLGRFGQFRYNNMDHAMLSGLLAVRRLLGEEVDPWAVNAEAEYLEEAAQPKGAGGLSGLGAPVCLPRRGRACAAN